MSTSKKPMVLPASINPELLDKLRAKITGRILTASDESYDSARQLWNGALDHRPAMIVVCATAEDVQTSVKFAQQIQLPLSVLAGGYDCAGRSVREHGLVIDLSAMHNITVDAEAQMAKVQGGATSAQLLAAAGPYGLTAVVGANGNIGVAGFTLGGGYGPLTPRFGLGADNLVSAEMVLADGSCVTASGSENADLFWALRGGGGNFGVVTSMQIRLHPVSQVLAGKILFPWSDAESVLTFYANQMASAPDELAVTLAMVTGPDGHPAIALAPCWNGDVAKGQEMVARMERLGSPIMSNVSSMPVSGLFGLFEPSAPRGRRYAQQTRWLRDMTPGTIADLIDIGSTKTSPFSAIGIQSFHGAGTRIALQSTAFGLRQQHFLVSIIAAWENGEEKGDHQHRQWAVSVSAKLERSAFPGGYLNLLGPDDLVQSNASYGVNGHRLLKLKQCVDPENLFEATSLPSR